MRAFLIIALLLTSAALAHDKLDCAKCHDSALLKSYGKLQAQLGTNAVPGWDRIREALPLGEPQVQALSAACATCHPQQAKDWAGSGHALTYRQSFLNREHNRMEAPMDDCLRCHAMFFEGTARELVQPTDTRGPWQMARPELADHRSIPCLVCHQIHRDRWPASNEQAKLIGDTVTNKVGFYDRRERRFFPAHQLPQPKVSAGDKPVKISGDVRQRVCYQCHAPSALHRTGTGDDRTLRGVHEGMSCLDCHAPHTLDARPACAECHPAVSSCGLDVTRMDTTARAKGNRHDIHTVDCRDCHPQSIPKPAAAAKP